MTFLPIVERELRVAARKRFTFWLRVLAAATALIIGSAYFLLMTAVPFAGAGFTVGGPLFGILTWLSLAVAMSAGVFFTSDCLSEEKREGTLGFLFLTDLRGYDVVLGKLFATSLRCAFALLALFPILAVTLLLGGVESGQFWRTMLALLNALFFSLATGMFISAISRNGQKALAGTIALLAVWTFGVPVLEFVLQLNPGHSGMDFSPAYVFRAADNRRGFWWALLLSQAVAWLQLALASVLVRHNWQVKDTSSTAELSKRRSWWRYGGERSRRALREKWLSSDPMLWLALRERGRVTAVMLVPALCMGAVIVIVSGLTGGEMWALWNFLSGAVSLVVYLSVASQAAQFFAEARRTRLVELLLAAPLSAHEIVMGPWRALVRQFAGLAVLLVAVQLLGAVFSLIGHPNVFAGMGAGDSSLVALLAAMIGAVVTIANLIAVGWCGLWMGMTSRNALLATLKTIVFVQIIPWFGIMIAAGMLVPLVLFPVLIQGGAGATTSFTLWYPLLSTGLAACLSLGKDYFFWRWSRRKLMRDFREQATRIVAPIVVHPPVARIPAPPIILARQ